MADNGQTGSGYGTIDSRPGLGCVIAAIALSFYDIYTHFKGINQQDFLSILQRFDMNVYFNMFIGIALVVHVVFLKYKQNSSKEAMLDIASIYLLALLVSVTYSMGGVVWYNALIHFVFAGFFLYYVLYQNPRFEHRYQANFAVLIVLFLDFFFFSLFNANKLLAPVWFFAAVIYTKPSKIKSWLFAIVLIIYVAHSVGTMTIYGGRAEMLNGKDVADFKTYIGTSWNNIKEFSTGIGKEVQRQKNITQAMVFGDYYTAEVDQNVQQQLGVSILEIKSSDPYIYEDEPATVYARVQARTLKDEIVLKNFCQASSILPDRIIPTNETVTRFNEVNVDCIFDKCRFSPGTKTITFNIGFNFQTMSYLRNYFMDKERMQTMIREDPNIIEPSGILTSLGIYDSNPIAKSTNGPIQIGMELEKSQPVGVDRNRDTMSFRLGITLENLWDGKIKNIKRLVIILPEEMDLEPDSTTSEGTYCGGYVFEPKTCNDIFGDDAGEWCDDAESNIYAIDQSGKNQRIIPAGQPGIDRYKSLICRASLPEGLYDQFLGNTPVTIKNFKVLSDYDYELVRSTSITVRKSEYGGCAGETAGESIEVQECAGFVVDKEDLPPSDHQESYLKYQSVVKNTLKSKKPTGLNDAKAESLLAAIMSEASGMGESDSNNNGIPDFVAGFGTAFPDVFIDNPFMNIEKAAESIKEMFPQQKGTENDKIKATIKKYSEEMSIEGFDQDKAWAYYQQWQNRICKAAEGADGGGTGGGEESIPITTLFKKYDLIGIDKNKDGAWSVADDDFYFIKSIKQGADSTWIYEMKSKAGNYDGIITMKIDTFEYYRNLDSGDYPVKIQRPASEPADWQSFIFNPTKQLSGGVIS